MKSIPILGGFEGHQSLSEVEILGRKRDCQSLPTLPGPMDYHPPVFQTYNDKKLAVCNSTEEGINECWKLQDR